MNLLTNKHHQQQLKYIKKMTYKPTVVIREGKMAGVYRLLKGKKGTYAWCDKDNHPVTFPINPQKELFISLHRALLQGILLWRRFGDRNSGLYISREAHAKGVKL